MGLSEGRSIVVRLLAVLGCLLAATAVTRAQDSCADCHLTRLDTPFPSHVKAWASSVHRNTGCATCHRGETGTFDQSRAHRGILGSRNLNSPVHPRNLPTTCGSCHPGPLDSFRASRHYELLRANAKDKGPTCSTCHGDVDGRLLSPKAVASECNRCHGPRGSAPRTDRATQARDQYEALNVVRQELKLADSLIKRVEDRDRRTRLREAHNAVQTPLTRAIAAGHRFVYQDMNDYLAVAQRLVQDLLGSLVNR